MKKTLSVIIIALLLSLFPTSALAKTFEPDVELTASNVLLASLDANTVVYEKNSHERIHPASTTKIMSAALALEMCDDLNVMVSAKSDLWDEFSTISGISTASPQIEAGEEMSMYDLIHCMLLVSANEAASVVADYFGREEFLAAMNAKAAQLGCEDTHFGNPSGLFTDNHYTTASDMYKITAWALTVPGFYEICQKARYTVPATNMNDERLLATTVLLQDPSSVYYTSYVKGVKTGTLPAAGRCLVTTAQKNGMSFLMVDMGAPYEASSAVWNDGTSTFTDTRLLYDWAFSSLKIQNVINSDTAVGGVELKHAHKRDELIVYGEGELNMVLDNSRESEPEMTYELSLPDVVYAPVEAGQIIGKASVYADGEYVGEISLISRESIEKSAIATFFDTLTEIVDSTPARIVIGVIFVAILFYAYYIFVVVAVARRKKKKKLAAKKAAEKRAEEYKLRQQAQTRQANIYRRDDNRR